MRMAAFARRATRQAALHGEGRSDTFRRCGVP
jgi:hypothetical protein